MEAHPGFPAADEPAEARATSSGKRKSDMYGPNGDSEATLTLGQLKRELAKLEAARDDLLRERKMFRRLGFSTERINLRLCQINGRYARYEQALHQRLADEQRPRGMVAEAGAS